MNLRVIGLTAVVVCAALVPLAASAGPASGPADAKPPVPLPVPGALDDAVSGVLPAPSADLSGSGGSAGTDGRPGDIGPEAARPVERCGPEVSSSEGAEAQTCVLTEGRDTWARTYYRNATGRELGAVLSLMGPGGRTVQTHCAVEAEDDPATCETPREPSAGGAPAYSAVAEFAARGTGGSEADVAPLLLRSGSNSGHPTGR